MVHDAQRQYHVVGAAESAGPVGPFDVEATDPTDRSLLLKGADLPDSLQIALVELDDVAVGRARSMRWFAA